MRRNSITFGESFTVVYDPLESSRGLISFGSDETDEGNSCCDCRCHGEPEEEEEEDYNNSTTVDERWYSSEDIKAMRRSMCNSCAEEEDDSTGSTCTRGLEIYGKTDDCEANRLRRKNIVRSVLALQDEHKQNKVYDEKGLKMMATALSKEAIKEAQNRAMQDSNEAYLLHSSCDDNSRYNYLKAKNAVEYAKKTTALGRCDTTTGAAGSKYRQCSPKKKRSLRENRRSSVGF